VLAALEEGRSLDLAMGMLGLPGRLGEPADLPGGARPLDPHLDHQLGRPGRGRQVGQFHVELVPRLVLGLQAEDLVEREPVLQRGDGPAGVAGLLVGVPEPLDRRGEVAVVDGAPGQQVAHQPLAGGPLRLGFVDHRRVGHQFPQRNAERAGDLQRHLQRGHPGPGLQQRHVTRVHHADGEVALGQVALDPQPAQPLPELGLGYATCHRVPFLHRGAGYRAVSQHTTSVRTATLPGSIPGPMGLPCELLICTVGHPGARGSVPDALCRKDSVAPAGGGPAGPPDRKQIVGTARNQPSGVIPRHLPRISSR
jgi:hypothetical protein